MKRFILIAIVALGLGLTSCEKNEVATYATIENSDFSTNDSWVLNSYTGANLAIVDSVLNYYDPVGDGLATATQYDVLTVGEEYTVIIVASDNNFAGVVAYAGTNSGLLIPYGDNGDYSVTLVADGTDFTLEINSGYTGECGVNLDNLSMIN